MKLFSCPVCSQTVFFENTQCLQCGRTLLYVPEREEMVAVEEFLPTKECRVIKAGGGEESRRVCANWDLGGGCNWSTPGAEEEGAFCAACALNEVIPDLSQDGARPAWARAETAKRRLLFTLFTLGLPVTPRTDGAVGLGFAFLLPKEGGPAVMTGHAAGLITLNLAEADDAVRTRTRLEMGEAYRTLLGHLRHEVGHYYWDLLVRNTEWLTPFREEFGDEQGDYAAALERHYQEGPPPDWAERHVSAYASAHPWEDWAETWAHYLHLVDTLEIARSYGLALRPITSSGEVASDLVAGRPAGESFAAMVQAWIPATVALNSFSRGLGRNDLYPFALPPAVLRKLEFVHRVVAALQGGAATVR